jgi:hypothetical protein
MIEISNYTFRPSRVDIPDGPGELTPSARALRKSFSIPINDVFSTELILTIPFDPENDREPFGELVNAFDRKDVVRLQFMFFDGTVQPLTGKVVSF